jgi:hypothetical protein
VKRWLPWRRVHFPALRASYTLRDWGIHIPLFHRDRNAWIRGIAGAALQLAACIACSSIHLYAAATPAQLINDVAWNERQAAKDRVRFMYLAEEKSTRTRGHLWTEKVVETDDGLLRRLIAEDGKPLPPKDAEAEDRRLSYLVAHPEEFRRLNQNRKDDEVRARDLLSMLPHAFLFEDHGAGNGCEVIAFRPDPAFHPANFQERVIHSMSGTVLVNTSAKRLCGIDAHLEHEVDFAFGLLGKVSQDGRASFTRKEVSPGNWKTAQVSVHIDGKLLLMKTISRDQESAHRDFKQIPGGLSLAAANALSRP